MRLFALLAIASLPLLGGCVASTCDVPTATIQWRLQDVNGNPTDCVGAGVTYVDVYIGAASPVRAYCVDGLVVVDTSRFAPGVYATVAEGIASDAAGTIYDRGQFDLTVSDCGGGRYYPVLGEALLNIDYHFAPVDQCHGGSMWFALHDDVAGQLLSSIDLGSSAAWKTAYGCYSTGSGTPLQFRVPFGTYTLQGIQEVLDPITAPVSLYETCTPTTLAVHAPGVHDLTPPDLLQTLPGAPICY
jgi:hypothetical protein